jgi:hypothetical protein
MIFESRKNTQIAAKQTILTQKKPSQKKEGLGYFRT